LKIIIYRLPVTRIGDSAFSSKNEITSITIPNSITIIGASAFYGCSNLTSIIIPDSVTSIECGAFEGCGALKRIYSDIDGEFILGANITYIGSGAFIGCEGVASIILPVYGCAQSGVIYPDEEPKEFAYFFSHEHGQLPTSLKTVTIINERAIGASAFYGCSGLTSITIPNNVMSIGSAAFYGCSGLTSITIGSGVTSICSAAFSDCSGLTSITIPDSVTSIGSYAFYGCSGLTSVSIPDSVTSIGGSAFSSCNGLTSITIPDSVTSIGQWAFNDCCSLADIILPFIGSGSNDSENKHFSYIFGAYSYYSHEDVPLSLKTVTITGGAGIEDYAFYKCSYLIGITIPDSVTSIGDHAFAGCGALPSITIPDSVTGTFKNSSLMRALKLSTYPFCHGLPGSTNIVVTPASLSHFFTSLAVNSGPLSLRRYSGMPCKMNVSARTCMTALSFQLRRGMDAIHMCLPSS